LRRLIEDQALRPKVFARALSIVLQKRSSLFKADTATFARWQTCVHIQTSAFQFQ
jgi:hypothetical protein